MNKTDLIKALKNRVGISYDFSKKIVDSIFFSMSEALTRGDRVTIKGFGTFLVKEYKGYFGRNPKTGESIKIGEKKLPKFKMSRLLKESFLKRKD